MKKKVANVINVLQD